MQLGAVKAPFDRPGWIYELKYDGFRAILGRHGDDLRMLSRRGNDMLACFPEIRASLEALPDVVIDGELVALDEAGRPQFEPLRRRLAMRNAKSIVKAMRETPALVFAFDLIALCGKDLRGLPLLARKEMLRGLLEQRPSRIRYTQHVGEGGVRLFHMAAQLGLEGIVAKRADSPYRAGRSYNWVKIKTAAGRAIDVERAKWSAT